jgi:hypothetical protein
LHHIYRTGGDGVWLHTLPRISDGLIVVLPEGSEFIVECWEHGDDVNGNPVWLRGSSSLGSGYVTDYYVDTRWGTTDDLTAQGISSCSGSPTPEAPAVPIAVPAAPSSEVNFRDDLSARGLALKEYEATIEAAAQAVGVHGQTLARVLHHEGGNYLSIRRTPTMVAEFALSPDHSVGIGQIVPSTARSVLEVVYNDPNVVNWDDSAIRNKLISDDNLSIRVAAGWLRMLQNAGITGEWPLFMAYSQSVNQAVAWKAAGHPMSASELTAIGFDDEHDDGFADFRERQQHYNETVAAIG